MKTILTIACILIAVTGFGQKHFIAKLIIQAGDTLIVSDPGIKFLKVGEHIYQVTSPELKEVYADSNLFITGSGNIITNNYGARDTLVARREIHQMTLELLH